MRTHAALHALEPRNSLDQASPAMSSEVPPSPKSQVLSSPEKSSPVRAVLIGAACIAGVHALNVFKADDRYPVRVEYELVKTCVTGSESYLDRNLYRVKEERCLCALEATTPKISYASYQKSRNNFNAAFNESVQTCVKKGRS